MLVIRKFATNRLKYNAKSLKQIINNTSRTFATVNNNNFIIDSGLPDVEIPKISIPDLLLPQFDKFENLIATECAVTGRKYTYRELSQKSKNLSRGFGKKLNLKNGDVVALLLPNIPEYPIAVLGALLSGIVVTTINPIYTAEEIARQLKDSSAKAVITLNQLCNVVNDSFNVLKKKLPILSIKTDKNQTLPEGVISFNEFTDSSFDFPDFKTEDIEATAFLPYSSGTTGLPKGVELSHRNIVSNVFQNDAPELNFLNDASQNPQDILPAVLPMFHIYGLTVTTIFALYKGCKIVALPKFTPELYISVLKNHSPTILFTVPPIMLFLAAHPEVKSEYLQSLRVALCGAAPLGALDEERFIEKVGKKVSMLQGYGLTETSPGVSSTTVKLKEEKNVAGSIGRPIPNTQVKIIGVDDNSGTPLGPNISGELLVKGPQVMKGYHNRPEETKNAFLDGWFRTGDMVYYNEDKVLYITDRLKELIKVKGFQVPPAELEEIIRDFPNVEEAAVIGVPHANHGEVPRAYVVAKKNTKINIKDLNEYVSKKVAEYKQLRGGICLVDSVPKNPAGKLLRRVLKTEYENSSR